MEHEQYIKLSRIRDYGIGKEEGDLILKASELDELDIDQLQGLREILVEEVGDIEYQIAHEQKHLEHNLKWHYGAKSSKKARENFIRKIEKSLHQSGSVSALSELLAFREANRENHVHKIEKSLHQSCSVSALSELLAFRKATLKILDEVDPALILRIEQVVAESCKPKRGVLQF